MMGSMTRDKQEDTPKSQEGDYEKGLETYFLGSSFGRNSRTRWASRLLITVLLLVSVLAFLGYVAAVLM